MVQTNKFVLYHMDGTTKLLQMYILLVVNNHFFANQNPIYIPIVERE